MERKVPEKDSTAVLNDTMSLIREANAIDRTRFSDSTVLTEEQFLAETTDGGAELKGYFKEGELLKIREWVGLSYGIRQREFYFRGEDLFYVHEQEDDFYVDTNGTAHDRFEQHFESNQFFASGKLIGKSSLGKRRFGDESPEIEEDVQAIAAKWRYQLMPKRY